MRFSLLLILLAIWMDLPLKAFTETQTATFQKVDHWQWDTLLKKYVDAKGNVDYATFATEVEALDTYLQHLANNSPATNWSKSDRLAYYINLYNAGTVKLILDHYPLKSIKDIKNPWNEKRIQLGKEMVSLGHIEHQILRKMDEPRIHFAINCASHSCPKLLNEAYTASKLESQLQKASKDFIHDPLRNQISSEKLQLSNIFKWYKKDFIEQGSVINYIRPYFDFSISNNAKIDYLKYDWSLNDSN